MEIVDGNMIIATFRGAELDIQPPEGSYTGHIRISNYEELGLRSGWVDLLDYHKSWDSLMPVVEEIESRGHWVGIEFNQCEIKLGIGESVYFTNQESKIKAVWLAVVEFILWYIKNKEKPF